MRSKLLFGMFGLLFTWAWLAGCSRSQDPKVAKLEAAIAERDRELFSIQTNLSQLRVKLDHLQGDSQLHRLMISNIFENDEGLREWVKIIDEHVDRIMTNGFSPPIYQPLISVGQARLTGQARPATQPTPATQSLKDGVPVAIHRSIQADAAKKWPRDYEMQAYEIKNQVEAYKKVNR